MVFKSFLILIENCLGIHMPTPPPLSNSVEDAIGW